MSSLAEIDQEHRERLVRHVERLHALAEMVDADTTFALAAGLDEEWRFIDEQLLPHMAAVETTLYGQLEHLLEGRHSMAPMRSEHAEIRGLVEALGGYRPAVAEGRLDPGAAMGLRRVLYRLHSMLRVHLAEEALYLRLLDANLSEAEKERLAQGLDHAAKRPV
jgi:hypothetical protein